MTAGGSHLESDRRTEILNLRGPVTQCNSELQNAEASLVRQLDQVLPLAR